MSAKAEKITRRSNQVLRRLSIFWPWVLSALGFLAVAVLVFVPVESVLLRVSLLVLSFFAIQLTAVFLHELGHLLACVFLRELPATLEMGTGEVLKEFKLGQISIRCRATTNSGLVRSKFRIRNFNRRDFFLLYASGPAMDIFGLGVVLKLLVSTPQFWLDLPHFDEQIKPLLIVTGCYLFYCHLSYLTRRSSFCPGENTDIGGLSTLWPILGAPEEIRHAYVRLANASESAEIHTCNGSEREGEGADLQTYYQWMLEQPNAGAEEAVRLKDAFITSVLLNGYAAQLPLADRYSAELFAQYPNDVRIMGSRGGVLVALGEIEKGKPLLEKCFAESKSNFDRAISAAFLAIAEGRSGNRAQEKLWLSKAIAADPHCQAIRLADPTYIGIGPAAEAAPFGRTGESKGP